MTGKLQVELSVEMDRKASFAASPFISNTPPLTTAVLMGSSVSLSISWTVAPSSRPEPLMAYFAVFLAHPTVAITARRAMIIFFIFS